MNIKKLLPAILTAALISATFLSSSCKKDITNNSNSEEPNGFADVSNSAEMQLPENFDFRTTQTIDYSFETNSIWAKEKIKVEVFDYNPTGGGDLVCSQFFGPNGTVSGEVDVPIGVKEIYVRLTNPNGNSLTQRVDASTGQAHHKFNMQKSVRRKTAVISPDCSTGCGTTRNNSTNWTTADNGGVYCYTGNMGGGINVRGGSTVRICGSGTFQLNIEGGATVQIADGADVTLSNCNVNSSTQQLIIYPNAQVSIGGYFSPNAKVVNHGDLTLQHLNINSGGKLVNNGTCTMTGTGYSTANDTLRNNGTMTMAGHFTVNSSGHLENNCRLEIDKQLILNKKAQNNAYMKVGGQVKLNSSGELNLNNGAMVDAEDLFLDGTISGTGSTSLFKLNDRAQGNSSGALTGNLELCDANGVESGFAAQFLNGAVAACNVYIPTSSCNPAGNGNPQSQDDDNDGVVNANDLFPNDPTASGAAFYPSATGFATLAFEDLWPGQGDFDFNDLVMDYRLAFITNANNKVVRLETKATVRAIGGSLEKGLGFALDNMTSSDIASVSGQRLTQNMINLNGNNTEAGQSTAVVILFDDAKSVIRNFGNTTFVNTIPNEARKDADTLNMVVTFASPKTFVQIGNINPFIFVRGERGREIHLPDQAPTDLMDATFFGQNSDDSDPASGRYFRTANHLPWGINIASGFDYPVEKQDIVAAYTSFDLWAQSGGSQHSDWYQDHAGYRDATKIF